MYSTDSNVFLVGKLERVKVFTCSLMRRTRSLNMACQSHWLPHFGYAEVEVAEVAATEVVVVATELEGGVAVTEVRRAAVGLEEAVSAVVEMVATEVRGPAMGVQMAAVEVQVTVAEMEVAAADGVEMIATEVAAAEVKMTATELGRADMGLEVAASAGMKMVATEVFTRLSQMCAISGQIPKIWKSSTVIPVPKSARPSVLN